MFTYYNQAFIQAVLVVSNFEQRLSFQMLYKAGGDPKVL